MEKKSYSKVMRRCVIHRRENIQLSSFHQNIILMSTPFEGGVQLFTYFFNMLYQSLPE